MKNLFKAILAAALTLSMLAAASAFLKPSMNNAPNRAEYAPSLYYSDSLDRMPKNSLDAVFIGSSQVFSALSPMEMWRAQGIAAYCCTSAGQQAVTSYYYLRSLLNRQTPRVVAVDVRTLYRDEAESARQFELYHRSAMDQMRFSPEKLALAMELWKQQDIGESFWSFLMPVLRFHTRWRELQETDLTLREDYDQTRGFNMVYGKDIRDRQNVGAFPFLTEEPTEALSEWDEEAAGWYRKMGELCTQRGIRLMLIKTPCTGWTLEDRNTMRKIASDCGADFLDFNDRELWEQMGFDCESDMIDELHLNYRGAEKLSLFFGELLRRDYGLPDHRGEEAYAFWDADLEAYDCQLRAWDVRHAHTGTELRSLVMNDGYEMLVVGMENAEPAFAEALEIRPEPEIMWISRWDGTRTSTEYTAETRGFFGAEEYEIDDTGIYMHGENYMVGDGGLYYVVRDRVLDKIIDYGTVDAKDALRRE